ncbi:MAG: hypothetical protein LBT46_15260 [Planctomycetaceae bacterium]|nr:hypothetical protein [Planctomycetaceae bacterium]
MRESKSKVFRDVIEDKGTYERVIAEIHRSLKGYEYVSLIAAAPEMYAVLSEIMDGKSGCDDEWSIQTNTGDTQKLDRMYERIRAILHKAKGEQNE